MAGAVPGEEAEMSDQTIGWPRSPEQVATMEFVALGAVGMVLGHYGLTKEEFFRDHPECLCHQVPAAQLRHFAISGGAA